MLRPLTLMKEVFYLLPKRLDIQNAYAFYLFEVLRSLNSECASRRR